MPDAAQQWGRRALDFVDAVERLDVIIELGARGSSEAMRRFRDRGGRLVSYVAGFGSSSAPAQYVSKNGGKTWKLTTGTP